MSQAEAVDPGVSPADRTRRSGRQYPFTLVMGGADVSGPKHLPSTPTRRTRQEVALVATGAIHLVVLVVLLVFIVGLALLLLRGRPAGAQQAAGQQEEAATTAPQVLAAPAYHQSLISQSGSAPGTSVAPSTTGTTVEHDELRSLRRTDRTLASSVRTVDGNLAELRLYMLVSGLVIAGVLFLFMLAAALHSVPVAWNTLRQ